MATDHFMDPILGIIAHVIHMRFVEYPLFGI